MFLLSEEERNIVKVVFDRKATLQKAKGVSKQREAKETSARKLLEQYKLKMIRIKNTECGEERKDSEVKARGNILKIWGVQI